jgi:hypothetical protein
LPRAFWADWLLSFWKTELKKMAECEKEDSLAVFRRSTERSPASLPGWHRQSPDIFTLRGLYRPRIANGHVIAMKNLLYPFTATGGIWHRLHNSRPRTSRMIQTNDLIDCAPFNYCLWIHGVPCGQNRLSASWRGSLPDEMRSIPAHLPQTP